MEGVINTPSIFLEKKLLEKFQSEIDDFSIIPTHSDIKNFVAVSVHIDRHELSNIRNIHPVVFVQHKFKDIFEKILQFAKILLMINPHAQRELAIIVKNHETSGVIVVIKLFENDLHNKFSLNLIVNKLNI